MKYEIQNRARMHSIRNNPCEFQVRRMSVDDLSDTDAIVAVMGPTGAGKSSFIEKATGIEGIVGHSLESCTDEISVFKLESVPGIVDSDICFVDTPGFDDTKKSDVDIFKMLSDWLNKTYKRNIHLTGLLYFHRISDNRMAGSPLKNLRLFEKLCGNNFNNIVLATTMWAYVEDEEGTRREQELKAKFWKAMIERGSTVKRFMYTRESAFDVLAPVFEVVNRRNALLLQREMSDLGMKLKQTSAGKTLYLELEGLVERQRILLGNIRDELKDPKLNSNELQRLMDEYRKVSEQLHRINEDLKKMKVSIGERILQGVKTVDLTRLFSFINTGKKTTNKVSSLPQTKD